MKLRKDVEGLRAVAILLVVAAHAGVPGMAGGFVGVDVFFVLSGFLITGLLVSEHARSGRLDFKAFYSRRFRRLLPALALMLVVTGALATQLVPMMQQATHAFSGAAAAMWLSNMHFALSATDYFAAHDNLYLHTWSLGVEEQFYLIWPMLLALTLSAGAARLARTKATMVTIVALSFAGCLALSWTSTLLAFYLMPLRAWQFGLGALVWLYVGNEGAGTSPHPPRLNRLAPVVAWTGLGAILFSALLLDGSHRYPGLWAALPTLGTCLVLIAGSTGAPTDGAMRVLAQPPVQWLGRMSYGWYLWHWPLLILGGSVFDMRHGWVRFALVSAALFTAWLSYHVVEQPIRHARRWPFAPMTTILLSFAIMICLAALGIRWEQAALLEAGEQRSPHRITMPAIYRMGCDRWYGDAELTPCTFEPGRGQARATIAMVGDSIGLQWFPAFAILAERHHWRLIVHTKSACPMVDETFYYQRIGRDYTECDQWRDAALAEVAALAPDAVIIGSSAGYAFAPEQWRNGTLRVLERLVAATPTVGILRATPVLPFSGVACTSFRTPLRNWLHQESRCSAPAVDPKLDAVAGHLRSAAESFANVHVIDLNDAVCPAGVCLAERDGLLRYRDTQHLNALYVEQLADPLEARLRQVMPALFAESEAEPVLEPETQRHQNQDQEP